MLALPRIEYGRPPHTIDRWDDATGENLIEQIAGVATIWSRWRLTGWAGAGGSLCDDRGISGRE